MVGRVGYFLIASLLTCAGYGALVTQSVFAISSSENYEVVEPEFGAGATLDSCSGSYCAKATIGSLNNDESSSQNYTVSFAPVDVNEEPMLDVIVEPGVSHLGELTTTKTAHKVMLVKVRSYLSGGYMVQVYGDPPRYQDHTLKTSNQPEPSTPGVEQFGINVVANSLSESFGANPVHVLSGQDGSDLAEDNYRTANSFMYESGAVVATNYNQSSEVHYSISMVVNVAGSTPAGHYAGDYSAIITPVF